MRCTEPEGICQSVSFYPGAPVPMPLGRMYTLGIRFFIGRCHAAALLPEVVPLIEAGRLRPGEVTTRVVDWEERGRGVRSSPRSSSSCGGVPNTFAALPRCNAPIPRFRSPARRSRGASA